MERITKFTLLFSLVLITMCIALSSPALAGGCKDRDNDGYFHKQGCGTAVDCNDADASINPGAAEVCSDGVDNNCDGQIDENCGGGAAVEFEIIALKTKVGDDTQWVSSYGEGMHSVVVSGNKVYGAFKSRNQGDDYRVRVGCSFDGGLSWLSPAVIIESPYTWSDGVGIAIGPNPAEPGSELVHLVWEDRPSPTEPVAIYYANGTLSSSCMWSGSTPQIVSGQVTVSNSSHSFGIATDPTGGVHISFDGGSGSYGVYYSHSSNGGTTFDEIGTLAAPNDTTGGTDIAVDSSGNAYISWDQNYGGVHFSSRPAGLQQPWSAPVLVSGSYAAWDSSIAALDSNTIYIAWESGQDTYVSATSNGGSSSQDWNQNVVPDIGRSCDPSLAVDTSGVLNLYGCSFARSTDNGQTWSTPTVIDPDGDFGSIAVDSTGKAYIMYDNWGLAVIYFSKEK